MPVGGVADAARTNRVFARQRPFNGVFGVTGRYILAVVAMRAARTSAPARATARSGRRILR
jgi:hypothetical protein